MLIAVLGMLLLLTACSKKEQQTTGDPETSAIVNAEVVTVDPFPNYSNLDLNEALIAFSNGDNDLSASYIRTAIADLSQTDFSPSDRSAVLWEKARTDLEKLAELLIG